MASIKIDDKEYNLDDMSDESKKQIASIQFAKSEIQRLEGVLAITRTAYAAYTQGLQNELNK